MTPITSKPAGNQQNQQHLYENFGVSDDYESLDMEKIETSTYERLQVNNKDMNSENETSVPNALKIDKENNKYAKDHRVEGIITVLLHLISLQLIGNNIVSLHNQTSSTKGSYKIKKQTSRLDIHPVFKQSINRFNCRTWYLIAIILYLIIKR